MVASLFKHLGRWGEVYGRLLIALALLPKLLVSWGGVGTIYCMIACFSSLYVYFVYQLNKINHEKPDNSLDNDSAFCGDGAESGICDR